MIGEAAYDMFGTQQARFRSFPTMVFVAHCRIVILGAIASFAMASGIGANDVANVSV